MIQRGLNTRVGPMCRTVEDVARVLDVYAGYDPKDELTAFSTAACRSNRTSLRRQRGRLDGLPHRRDPRVHGQGRCSRRDSESIDLVDRGDREAARSSARRSSTRARTARCSRAASTSASPSGRTSSSCAASRRSSRSTRAARRPATTSRRCSTCSSIRRSCRTRRPAGRASATSAAAAAATPATAKYNFNHYIRERGDAEIESLTDLITKANFWTDPVLHQPQVEPREHRPRATLATASALQTRFAMQTVVFDCFAQLDLDAVVYPSGNIPPGILTSPAGADRERPRPQLDDASAAAASRR